MSLFWDNNRHFFPKHFSINKCVCMIECKGGAPFRSYLDSISNDYHIIRRHESGVKPIIWMRKTYDVETGTHITK